MTPVKQEHCEFNNAGTMGRSWNVSIDTNFLLFLLKDTEKFDFCLEIRQSDATAELV